MSKRDLKKLIDVEVLTGFCPELYSRIIEEVECKDMNMKEAVDYLLTKEQAERVAKINEEPDFIRKAREDRTPEELKILNMNKKESYDYINPNHYKQSSKEVIEMMEDVWGTENLIAHCEMCAFKYRMRLGSKPEQPVERDLEKARWYEDYALHLKNK